MIVEPSDVDIQARRARDRALVEAHCSGDPRAFPTIVADHYRVLLVQADRRLGDRGAAEDAVQETFERAFRAVCRFGSEGDYRLGAWLSRILANVCADHGGRVLAERNLSQRVAHEVHEPDPVESVSDPLILRAVRDAIAALPSSQRDTFLLKEMDGLSYPQIADRLEISEDNARARVHRARATLRRSLALTRAMFGAVIAVPVGMRTLFRKARGYVPASQSGGAAEVGSSSTAQTLAAHVASSPVVQSVVSMAPSGAFRGSMVAGLASLAITGAIAIPVATSSGDHSRPSTHSDSVQVAAADASATQTTQLSTTIPTDPKTESEPAPAQGPTTHGDAPWWQRFVPLGVVGDQPDAPASGDVGGDAPAAPPACAGSVAAASAAGLPRVVSTLDLPSAAVSVDGDWFTFDTSAELSSGGDSATLTAIAAACLAPGTAGTLNVTLTNGSRSAHLVAASVYSADGTWIFRGTASGDADGLPWGVRDGFLAQLVLTGAPDGQQTATLSFAFLDADGTTDGQDQPDPIVVSPPPESPPVEDPADGGGGPESTPPPTTVPPETPPTTEPPSGSGSTGDSGPATGS